MTQSVSHFERPIVQSINAQGSLVTDVGLSGLTERYKLLANVFMCRQVVRFIKKSSSQGLSDFHSTLVHMIRVFVIKWGVCTIWLVYYFFFLERERKGHVRFLPWIAYVTTNYEYNVIGYFILIHLNKIARPMSWLLNLFNCYCPPMSRLNNHRII